MTESVRVRRRLAPTDRRAQLAAVGAEVFAAQGYQATSLEDIAASAGVTRPLIYRYFRDKDDLYSEILARARADLDGALVAAVASVSAPADQLRAGITAFFEFVGTRGSQWDLLFGGGSAVTGPVAYEAARMRFQTAELIASLVSSAAPDVDPVAASAYAHAISGAAEQLAKWWRQHPSVDVETLVDYQLDVVWGGLARLAPGSAM